MHRLALLLAAPIATLCAAPVLAQEAIGTIQRGSYACELPGHAGREASIAMPEASFRIRGASRYVSPQGDGTYLRRGDRVTFTSGPHNGDSYRVEAPGSLRKLEDGAVTRLRCIRRSR
ncbi:elongation factor P [Erythrobacter arachoides]|uniref:Elongation factor P n=1 Tax=Aurantiacibacter arachoides TaxID=1850444 RepID=A0A845A736_9SPHN|nr:elongation factor P [Aurantiacibacter arachoides]MXO93349.1 elongation factor P [Aurantiacibacter arachoides]GGD50093.1 hypothetical protein GCM10011411_07330 [Aurantiacibacter arachoides]